VICEKKQIFPGYVDAKKKYKKRVMQKKKWICRVKEKERDRKERNGRDIERNEGEDRAKKKERG